MADNKPKQYSLKPVETQMLQIMQQQHSALLSNFLSFIGMERLAINITPNTRFDISPDMTEITITETEPEQPTEDAGIVESVPPKGRK